MKKVLYVILALVLIYLGLCAVGPREVKVERSTTIAAPAELIKKQLGDFTYFHDAWSPWSEKDTAMKVTYSGEAGMPGHSYTWEGNKEVGKGSMTLTGMNGDSVNQSLVFDGMEPARSYFIVTPENGMNKVTWGMNFHVGFFARGFMLFMNMDKMVGADYEKGLAKLKPALEEMAKNQPPANDTKYEVTEGNWEARTYFGKKTTTTFDKLSAFFAASFPKLFNDTKQAKLQPLGAPSAIFYTFDQKNMTTECAAVVALAPGSDLKGWEKIEVPACKVVQVAYYGPYEKSMGAHKAISAYMEPKGMKESLVIEEYVTDPMTEKDSTKWLTNIYYLVK
jgi:hypothetical protein